MSRTRILLLIFFTWTAFASAQSVNVPLTHWVYGVLDRLQTRGLVREGLTFARPYSRSQVARMLSEAIRRNRSGEVILSETEQSLLDQLAGEFSDETPLDQFTAQDRWRERHLATWRDGATRVHADLVARQAVENRWGSSDSKTLSRTTGGGILRGNLMGSMGFYLSARNTLTRGGNAEEQFDPALGEPVTVSGENAYSDDASAYLIWKLPWFTLQFGRDRARWGPGLRGGLMLSENMPRFEMIRLHAKYKGVTFTSIHGKLSGMTGDRYMAAHRLELAFSQRLVLGLAESVIYGGRSVEPGYLNPLMIYHVAEHHLGDRDNNTMGLDVTLFPLRGHKVYAELFLDDFTTARNPFTYYGNKFAFTAGWRWVNPFGLRDADLDAEYTRVEPYVYTHKDSLNIYTHTDRSIGSDLGPDSDQWILRLGRWMHRSTHIGLVLDRIRKGPGAINVPHRTGDGERKRFLSGVVEGRWITGLEANVQIAKDIFLLLRYARHQITNTGRIEGLNSVEHRLLLELSVNY